MAWPKGKPNPAHQVLDEDTFIEEFYKMGAAAMSRKHQIDVRGIHHRRRGIEKRRGIVLTPPSRGGHVQQLDKHPASIQLGIQDGIILVGSDAHYWPGIVSTAHRAFVEFCKEYKPKVVVMNGDVMDFPSISRFEASSWLDWENRPSVADEIENAAAMLEEIKKASKGARHIFPLGNHDARLETRIASKAPELAKMKGVHLKDHFPDWEPCYAALVNNDTVIKHRMKGGIHATRNNTLNAGRTMVTGHLHSMKVTALSDYNGTRWGVDCGTMADPYGPQFSNYVELNPLDWRSGFCLLTIKKGKLLWPELVWVSGPGTIQFRGKEWSV